MSSMFMLALTCDNCDKTETRASDGKMSPWIRGYAGLYAEDVKDPQCGWDACQDSCVPGAVAKALGTLNPAWQPVT